MIVTGTKSTWIRKGSSDKFRNIFNSRYVDQSFRLEIQIWFLEILWRKIGASRYEEPVKKQYKIKFLRLYHTVVWLGTPRDGGVRHWPPMKIIFLI
jgi:hypothetical protein